MGQNNGANLNYLNESDIIKNYSRGNQALENKLFREMNILKHGLVHNLNNIDKVTDKGNDSHSKHLLLQILKE